MDIELVSIGEILKPVGLRGEVKVLPLTDFPERFKELRDVVIQIKRGESQICRILDSRYAPPFVYLFFSGFSSLEEARPLAGALIQIPEKERRALPQGSYYQSDIEGLDVYLEEGTFLGKVTKILQTGSNDVYVVAKGEAEFLIPALRTIVKEINLIEKRMTIRPVEGLFG